MDVIVNHERYVGSSSICLALGFLLYIVGFSCPAWSYSHTRLIRYAGLWDYDYDWLFFDQPRTTQILSSLALVCFFIALGFITIFWCGLFSGYRMNVDPWFSGSGLFAVLGGVLGMSGAGTYSNYLHNAHLGWAYTLTLIASIFNTIIGLFGIARCVKKNYMKKNHEELRPTCEASAPPPAYSSTQNTNSAMYPPLPPPYQETASRPTETKVTPWP